ALLNSQPMGFYAPAQLVRNAQEHGVEVLPIDINRSDWDCTLEASGTWDGSDGRLKTGPRRSTGETPVVLRLGLRMLVGLREEQGRRIEAARREGAFQSLDELAERTGVGRGVMERLAAGDVC